jgi:CTP:phosphocholine cytidylyltransferase-like protein
MVVISMLYNKKVIEGTPMQLTTLVTTVDFFPEAFIAEEDGVIVKRFQKRVTWNSNGISSYSTVTALTARNEWSERIANGAEVTDLNLQQMPRSEYTPMACVG